MARVTDVRMHCHNKLCLAEVNKTIVAPDEVIVTPLDNYDRLCPYCGFASLKIMPHPSALEEYLDEKIT